MAGVMLDSEKRVIVDDEQGLPDYEVAIAGSGFAGLGMAIGLRRAGIEDFVMLERGDQLGGTWRDNHYPGCACDVPTPLYSYSFAPNPRWSHMYARSEEIRLYLEDCADRFGVRPHLRLGADVTGARWDSGRQRWVINVGGAPALTARMVVGGFGGLNRPAFPDIDGLEDYRGALFHSAQWDHDVPLEGRRVAVIGTGASAIQLIPELARTAGQVVVYQRTPPWVLPKADRRISRLEQELYARLPITQRAVRGLIFAFTEAIGHGTTRRLGLLAALERVGRAHLRAQVKDPELRRALTPSYRLGCKRILFSNDYYRALARPGVDVVTDGIVRVTANGIVTTDGVEREFDALVCSTGFRIEEVFSALDVRGNEGIALQDVWADGISAHRGTTIAGFPNLALLSGPNTGTGSTSQVYMIEAQIQYVLEMLRMLRERGAGTIEPRAEAQAEYNAWLQARMQHTVWLRGGCQSWYLDEHGVNRTLYPGPGSEFWRSLRTVREDEYILEPVRGPVRQPDPVAVN
jgi:cation diffusion facilitator CzcD-associated flavoprotein CzcO